MTATSAKEYEFLTNEPMEGESLANRLARAGLPAEETLRYAIEIGAALNRAHKRGVHGKLSPHAILLTAAGARILRPVDGADLDALPYRAPEQVAGKPADTRSDIFSYGTLLYEMVSGRRAFGGEGAALNQAILEKPPATLMGKSPIHAAMEGVIAGCLEKDPALRRQRVQNAVLELRLVGRGLAPMSRVRPMRPVVETASRPSEAEAPQQEIQTGETDIRPKRPRIFTPVHFPDEIQAVPGRSRRQTVMLWLLLAVSATLVGSCAWILWQVAHPVPVQVVKFPVAPPENVSYRMPAVSPDGKFVVVQSEGPDGQPMLRMRRLDELKTERIAGTEGGFAPFWSPDSKFVGFFADKALKKVRLSDGNVQKLCDAEALAGGGTWNRSGVILFAPSQGGSLYKVSDNGGKPEAVLKLDPGRGERAHLWPQFLPDGAHFIFFVLSNSQAATGAYTGELGSSKYAMVLPSQTNAVYSPPASGDSGKHGFLVYIRERSLMGVGFDASHLKLVGEPRTLDADVGAMESLSLAPVSISNNAVLVYQSVGAGTVRQLAWLDRGGKTLVSVNESGLWGPPRISPDGTRAAVAKVGKDRKNADLWLVDQAGNAVQFTSGPADKQSPVWSPDGSRIAYFVSGQGSNDLVVSPANAGSRADVLLKTAEAMYPTDWSRDGKYLLFGVIAEATKGDVWGISLADKHAGPLLDTIYNEGYAALSPDGRWMAFQSDDMGHNQVYVEPFDGITRGIKRRYPVSGPEGSGLPRWSADGKELFYITGNGRMMAASVHPQGTEFQRDPPQVLFQTRTAPNTFNFFDASPDGQRFLMNLPYEWPGSSPYTVMTNWTEKLKD